MSIKTTGRQIAKWFLGLISDIRFFYKKKDSLHYRDLYYLSYYNSKKFITRKSLVINDDITEMKIKKTIKIGFVTYSPSMWNVSELYSALEKNSRFDVSIIVGEFQMPDKNAMKSTFYKSVSVFKKKYGDRVVTAKDKGFCISKYDILIYCTPFDFFDSINIRDLSLTQLCCYVSYSYMLAEKIDKLDLPAYFLSWKMFCDSNYYLEFIKKNSRIKSDNAVFLGFVKMDSICNKPIKARRPKKTIIYAPHHSLTSDRIKFSTFDENYRLILELAKKYKDEVFWIVKPHPMLRSQAIKIGLFNDESEYDSYLSEWVDSGAGIVIENGDYLSLFLESNGMITDSVSFMAEYQFTHNPLLLLESGQQKYNEFGDKIREILYKCSGNDLHQIELFIVNIVRGIDPDYNRRMDFFYKELDYYTGSNKYAFERIYDFFASTFSK